MKVLFLCMSDLAGGANVASHRLFQSLKGYDVELAMEVQQKVGWDPSVRKARSGVAKIWDQCRLPIEIALIKRFYPRSRTGYFMPARFPDGLRRRIDAFNPDLLHVHWVGHAYLRPETLRGIKCPIVWTLHDMGPLTGGCYYDGGCGRYAGECGKCPVLGSNREGDLSRRVWRRKRDAWRDLNLTLVAPSRWLAACAQQSSLHRGRRVEVIPYGVSPQTYRPWPKALAREMLRLPAAGKIVLFGAVGLNDPRKGFSYLQVALRQLTPDVGPVHLAVFGGHFDHSKLAAANVHIHTLGALKDELSTALAYAAADVFVAPSLEDNLPNTVLESLMSGTPVVGFRVGGIPDAVEHGKNGLLVDARDADELSCAIGRILQEDELRIRLGQSARAIAEINYSPDLQSSRYLSLYRELVNAGARH